MFEVICREIKIMLVDTWVLGLTLEVCLIYFLGMAVLSNWQNNKAISVGLVLLGIFAMVVQIKEDYTQTDLRRRRGNLRGEE